MTINERNEESFLSATLINDVVRQLQLNDVDELEVSDGHSRLYIRREPGARAGVPEPASPAPIESATVGVPITAPLTGVFYLRPSPDQPEYVSVGADITIDDVVGLIETMKLFNEVKADVAGRVTEITVRDGDLVEVGRPLMFVSQVSEDTES